MLTTEPRSGYDRIDYPEFIKVKVRGRSQSSPGGCKYDRIVTVQGDRAYVQFKSPRLDDRYAWSCKELGW